MHIGVHADSDTKIHTDIQNAETHTYRNTYIHAYITYVHPHMHAYIQIDARTDRPDQTGAHY